VKCPRCKGAIIGGSCINCGWEGPTKTGAENPPVREREREVVVAEKKDNEQKYEEQQAKHNQYHKEWQKRNEERVKKWHKASYKRRKAEKGKKDAGEETKS
jgi:hypothetical protein